MFAYFPVRCNHGLLKVRSDNSTCTRFPFFVPLNKMLGNGCVSLQENLQIIYVLSSFVATNKADCFDLGMITDGVDCRDGPVNDVKNTFRQT